MSLASGSARCAGRRARDCSGSCSCASATCAAPRSASGSSRRGCPRTASRSPAPASAPSSGEPMSPEAAVHLEPYGRHGRRVRRPAADPGHGRRRATSCSPRPRRSARGCWRTSPAALRRTFTVLEFAALLDVVGPGRRARPTLVRAGRGRAVAARCSTTTTSPTRSAAARRPTPRPRALMATRRRADREGARP